MPEDVHPFTDEMFDVEAVVAGAWSPSPYGPEDRLGTYNEVTASGRAAALGTVDPQLPVATFSLGETVFEGFPAFGDRPYRQRLVVAGYRPPDGFGGEVVRAESMGPNRLSYHEERVTTTYNLGSKINGLLHCGVGDLFYNGVRGADIARTGGAAEFDNTTWGPPLLTRGYLIDVVAVRAAVGAVASSPDGVAMLPDDYRITLDDLHDAVERQSLPAFEPGDVIMIHTGWNALVRTDPQRYLAASPGVWLRETRWLASLRPALVGVDSWIWGTLDTDVVRGNWSACHQELLCHHGVRLGEGMHLAELAAAGVDRFVFCHAPLAAEGATAASSPAVAIANTVA